VRARPQGRRGCHRKALARMRTLMGAGNVKLVYGLWGHLPDRAFRLLAYMALSSLDTDEPPRFWGGREAAAIALGRDLPRVLDRARSQPATGAGVEIERQRAAAFQDVKKWTRVLLDAGAIARAGGPARVGHNAGVRARVEIG
jgi:hypothetical protein